jgi:phosphatidylglycerol:prolipoprotein diacylglycerol transferase
MTHHRVLSPPNFKFQSLRAPSTLTSVHPIAFRLGPLTIHWYGVMMAAAFLVGLWTASRRAPRDGVSGEKIVDAGVWILLGAIIGARFLYVISYWDMLFDKPLFPRAPWTEVFMVQRGGLVYYGGLIGASLAGIIYARVQKLPLWKLADIFAPSIALGYVFGRIGCFLNGCCHGRVCDLPWAVRYPNLSDIWQKHLDSGLAEANGPSAPVHPTQIYDALLNLALYAGLAWLFRRKKFDGQIFAIYLLCYAVTRSIVEVFRGDYAAAQIRGGLTPAHLISIGIFLTGVVVYAVLRQRKASTNPVK